ncbi:MAG: hypothetical protein JW863_05580 [Chitinispirillaceae bacterium]|nr:hypothetical protein [Chitinispirillaceae bacterium]
MRIFPVALFLLLPVCFNAFSIDTDNEAASSARLSISGAVDFDIAEFVKMRNYQGMTSSPGASATLNRIWFGHTIGILNLESKPLGFLKMRAEFEFNQYMTTRPTIDGASPNKSFGQSYWNAFYIREGQGFFSFIDNDRMLFDAALGYFPYKYNPEVRNLGEFLFRSGTYPLYLLGEFDRPFARLTGLRTGFEYHNNDLLNYKIDILALLERTINPFNTISLASVASVNMLKIIDIGAGIDFAHAIPMNSKFTMVEQDESHFISDSTVTEIIDSSTSPPTIRIFTEIEYDHYDFRGIKWMARATIDPFGMVRENHGVLSDILGKDGGKVYGEYAVIGTKNYPAAAHPTTNFNAYQKSGYQDVKERSPWMAGITIPCWKVLDICAIEIEHFPSYYADDYYTASTHGFPLPAPLQGETYDSTTFVPRWNWSLYLKKDISRNVTIIAQAARDHQRAEKHPGAKQFNDYGASTVKKDEWGWHLCARFHF